MKVFRFLLALLLLSVIFHQQTNCQSVDLTPCTSGQWIACGIAVGTAVYNKYHSWSDVDTKQAFGTTCYSQFKGGFHRWEWKWSGKFWCPSLSSTIQGESTQWKSRTGAIEHAIQDYVTKMTQAGLLTVNQLKLESLGVVTTSKKPGAHLPGRPWVLVQE
ncbi:unnamed protein product [Rotaria sp. Silwood2]|nr:unnamed protein product [Rotaria sp. Silwood2]CAF3073083.1 unnamed protein product [Rotaria sp. Silwood2]CAF3086427.1 unnamed protein product [Rotaria sp. Silwood2]CAF4082813.1 unnamed protein product [Rotaria sp. Silwood2]CAF4512880.1 unnamed protein product [Rotaria sp. Silwood2]